MAREFVLFLKDGFFFNELVFMNVFSMPYLVIVHLIIRNETATTTYYHLYNNVVKNDSK